MAFFTFKIIAALVTMIVVTQGRFKFPRHRHFRRHYPVTQPTVRTWPHQHVTQSTTGTPPPIPPDACDNQPLVDSVEQAGSQKIVCLRTPQKELEKRMEKIGGFPKRYVGITKEDACNFTLPSFTELIAQNIQQFSATTAPPQVPQRDSSSADDTSYSDAGKKRRRRSSNSKSTQVACVGKSTPVSGNSDYYHMCDLCWQTTTLDDTKFPKEINEVVCTTTGAKHSRNGKPVCLGGEDVGVCEQKVIRLTFLEWKGFEETAESTSTRVVLKQKWVEYTQEIRSCCECEGDKTTFS